MDGLLEPTLGPATPDPADAPSGSSPADWIDRELAECRFRDARLHKRLFVKRLPCFAGAVFSYIAVIGGNLIAYLARMRTS